LERIVGGSFDNIGKFWDAMADHPSLQDHPYANRPNFKDRCIPISLHGDGVPVTKSSRSGANTVDIFSWNSMIGRGTTLQTNFLIFLIYGNLVYKLDDLRNANKVFSKTLCWSLYWLGLGVWPTRDENNRPIADGRAGTQLADGYYGALWGIRGDLDHMFKFFGFPSSSALSPCGLCQANKSTHPWTDARPTAKWITTVWTPTSYATHHPDRHAVFKLPGVSILNFIPDVMHVMHIGIYQWFYGSVLKLLIFHLIPGTLDNSLDQVWDQIKHFYQAFKTQPLHL
jgi:hypothetical protein